MSDLARATSDLFRIVRGLPEAPRYLISQIQRLTAPMSKEDGAIEGLVALWDVTRCEELPAWVRLEADRIRKKLWIKAYVGGKTLEIEVARICDRRVRL